MSKGDVGSFQSFQAGLGLLVRNRCCSIRQILSRRAIAFRIPGPVFSAVKEKGWRLQIRENKSNWPLLFRLF